MSSAVAGELFELERFVHNGGELHRDGGTDHTDCNTAVDALVATIEETLPAS